MSQLLSRSPRWIMIVTQLWLIVTAKLSHIAVKVSPYFTKFLPFLLFIFFYLHRCLPYLLIDAPSLTSFSPEGETILIIISFSWEIHSSTIPQRLFDHFVQPAPAPFSLLLCLHMCIILPVRFKALLLFIGSLVSHVITSPGMYSLFLIPCGDMSYSSAAAVSLYHYVLLFCTQC